MAELVLLRRALVEVHREVLVAADRAADEGVKVRRIDLVEAHRMIVGAELVQVRRRAVAEDNDRQELQHKAAAEDTDLEGVLHRAAAEMEDDLGVADGTLEVDRSLEAAQEEHHTLEEGTVRAGAGGNLAEVNLNIYC